MTVHWHKATELGARLPLACSTQVLLTLEVPGTQPWAAPTRQLQRQPLNEWGLLAP